MINRNIQYKYKIRERLIELSYKEYKLVMKALPKALNISTTTFNKYINTKIYEGYSMPADHLVRLARFFNCSVEDLVNYDPPPLRVKGIRRQKNIDIRRKFKLVK